LQEVFHLHKRYERTKQKNKQFRDIEVAATGATSAS